MKNVMLTTTELALILGALNEHMENMEWDEKEMTPDEVDDALDSYTNYRTLYNHLLDVYDISIDEAMSKEALKEKTMMELIGKRRLISDELNSRYGVGAYKDTDNGR